MIVHFFIGDIVKLNRQESNAFFFKLVRLSEQESQVVAERLIAPLLHDIRIAENKKDNSAVVHFLPCVGAEPTVSVGVIGCMLQVVTVVGTLCLKEGHKLVFYPLLRRSVVADKDVVVLISNSA